MFSDGTIKGGLIGTGGSQEIGGPPAWAQPGPGTADYSAYWLGPVHLNGPSQIVYQPLPSNLPGLRGGSNSGSGGSVDRPTIRSWSVQ